MEASDLFPHLRDLSEKLESHYKDMCDIEFTVQEGKLYLLNSRVGKRTAHAAIRIATDMFLGGKITGKALVERIDPNQVRALLKPAIVINTKVSKLGNGLPASPGAAVGVAAFSAARVIKLAVAGSPVILLRPEVVPDDIHGIEGSAGVVTFRGGMTSHAAVICCGMKKPCVTALGWSFDDDTESTVHGPRGTIQEGDPLTIDGSSGVIYAGLADIKIPKVFENDRLLLLFRLIDVLSAENGLPQNHIGRAWQMRDIMLHGSSDWSRPDPICQLKKWPVGSGARAKAFGQAGPSDRRHLIDELSSFRLNGDSGDNIEIWDGFRSCLLRLLSKSVGLGRHPEFWRPVFDPCRAVLDTETSVAWGCRSGGRIQVIGEEFFSINFHVPELIDIATVRICWAVQCNTPADLWRLDRTNPAGEKLLRGSTDIKALKVVVNDATVPHSVLGAFYNAFRRREYYWDWYRANNISRREIIGALKESNAAVSSRARDLARRAGLVSDADVITAAGESLLRPSSAVERVRLPVRIGW